MLDFINWMVLIFILIYLEWRDTENQQFKNDNGNEQENYTMEAIKQRQCIVSQHRKRVTETNRLRKNT